MDNRSGPAPRHQRTPAQLRLRCIETLALVRGVVDEFLTGSHDFDPERLGQMGEWLLQASIDVTYAATLEQMGDQSTWR